MLNLLTKKKENNANFKAEELTILLSKLTQIYQVDDINQNRKKYLKDTINKFGYLPYPQYKVLQELTNAETIFCLIEKLKKANDYPVVTKQLDSYLALLDLDKFMKELGVGFCYIESEYKIKIGDRYNYIDLLLYNIVM